MFSLTWFSPPTSLSDGDEHCPLTIGALSIQDFHRALTRERARADRTEHEFSVLLLHGDAVSNPRVRQDFINRITKRIRRTDEVGWFDARRIGVILPCTSPVGARTLAHDIRGLTPLPPACAVYTYPGQWLADEGTGSGSGFDNDVKVCGTEPVSIGNAPGLCPAAEERLFGDRTPLWKRLIDVLGAVVALLILSPLALLAAITIAAVSPGPVFLKQTRVGHQGRPFTIWKFRTMKIDSDTVVHQNHLSTLINSDAPMTKLDAAVDPRIIPFGNIIRKTCLDELPQLLNVLRGDMSLVGPRPCIPYEARAYRLWQTRRFDVIPGMTGLWQVSGKNRTTFKEMIRLDLAYARRRSPGLDLQILLRTAPSIAREIINAGTHRRTNVSY